MHREGRICREQMWREERNLSAPHTGLYFQCDFITLKWTSSGLQLGQEGGALRRWIGMRTEESERYLLVPCSDMQTHHSPAGCLVVTLFLHAKTVRAGAPGAQLVRWRWAQGSRAPSAQRRVSSVRISGTGDEQRVPWVNGWSY